MNTARDDFPYYAFHAGWDAMADEIDRLRAQVERDRPVIEAAREVVSDSPDLDRFKASLVRLAAAVAARAPDEVNEAET